MAFKVYSIESRKGGVGKTTIALNLAKLFLKSRKGPVLLLDCDITGTSISLSAKQSPFWERETNVLKGTDGNLLNLLGYYNNVFIQGKSLEGDFVTRENIKENKINVIGSEIYGPSPRAIIDTRMLMDDLHSYWLMEFIQSIISSFESLFQDKTVHVIIDNSPGYVGFCEALHNYMFNLGPEKAKFIMVSSFDSQDLLACMQASEEICYNVKNRAAIANYYCSITKNGGDNDEGMEQKINNDDNFKQFYLNLREDEQMLDSYTNKQYEENNYLSMIINKAPQVYKEDQIVLSFKDIVTDESFDLFTKITSARDETPQTIIYYDEAIVYQNYLKFLKVQDDDKDKNSYWTRRFKDLAELNSEYERQDDVLGSISKLNILYGKLLNNLRLRGYARMAKRMPLQWSPAYSLNRLNNILLLIVKRTKHSPNFDSSEKKEKLHDWISKQLQSVRDEIDDEQEYGQLSALASYVEEKVGVWDEKFSEHPLEVIALYLYVYIRIYLNFRKANKTFREFLLNLYENTEYGTYYTSFLDDEIFIAPDYIVETKEYRVYFRIRFYHFAKYFSYALLRIIDKHLDFNALLSALKLYVQGNTLLPFSKEMIDYLDSVIVRKQEKFDADKLVRINANSFVMKNAQDVIRDFVLKTW